MRCFAFWDAPCTADGVWIWKVMGESRDYYINESKLQFYIKNYGGPEV